MAPRNSSVRRSESVGPGRPPDHTWVVRDDTGNVFAIDAERAGERVEVECDYCGKWSNPCRALCRWRRVAMLWRDRLRYGLTRVSRKFGPNRASHARSGAKSGFCSHGSISLWTALRHSAPAPIASRRAFSSRREDDNRNVGEAFDSLQLIEHESLLF